MSEGHCGDGVRPHTSPKRQRVETANQVPTRWRFGLVKAQPPVLFGGKGTDGQAILGTRERSEGLDQLFDRRAFFQVESGPAARVEIGAVERDAEVAIDGGRQIAGCDGTLFDLSAVAFRGSNDLAMTQAAASQRHRHYDRPVVAAVAAPLRADLRRAAKLAHRQHQYVVE